jgi:HAD superfamily hydrolase (TIGR01509 family)
VSADSKAASAIEAVVFDLDGVLIESEEDWEQARRDLVAGLTGGAWSRMDQLSVLGTNMRQCAELINLRHPTGLPDEEVGHRLIERRIHLYEERLKILPGAVDAVRASSAMLPIAIASSSPIEIINFVLDELGVTECFSAIASSDEVLHGKPEPDVYLLACERLDVAPPRALAVEDSEPGIQSAWRAGMRVVALPNPSYRPSQASLALAVRQLASLGEFENLLHSLT